MLIVFSILPKNCQNVNPLNEFRNVSNYNKSASVTLKIIREGLKSLNKENQGVSPAFSIAFNIFIC